MQRQRRFGARLPDGTAPVLMNISDRAFFWPLVPEWSQMQEVYSGAQLAVAEAELVMTDTTIAQTIDRDARCSLAADRAG